MFTHHGTHIVGLTAASKHVAMALERATMISFETTERNWWLLGCWGRPWETMGGPFAFCTASKDTGLNVADLRVCALG